MLLEPSGAAGGTINRDAAALVAPIDGGAVGERTFGGKGEWLNKLVRAGFAVPASVVLTTHAFRAVAADPTLAALLATLRATDPVATDATAEQAQVDQAFLQVPLPDAVRDALDRAFTMVVPEGEGRVAVRSSATAEDMAGTSFAGQYTSFLNIDRPGFERAVRLVWASLWHPAPRWYRRFNGIDEEHIGMAVVAMPMVDAEIAGVAFSVDPGGAPDAVRVEVVSGLGEQLVSGAVTPRVHLAPRDAARRPGTHVADATGTTEVTGSTEVTEVTEVAEVAEVAALALAIEQAFGAPQDIEWAVIGGELFVLQARPITALPRSDDGFDSPASATTWTTVGIGEMLPGHLPPLVWDVNRRLLEEAFRELYGELRTLPADLDDRGPFLARFRGQAVLNLDLIGAVSGGAPDEVEQQYFGTEATAPPAGNDGRRPRRGLLRAWQHNRRLERVRRQSTVAAASTVQGVASLASMAPEPTGLDDAALQAYRHRLMDMAASAMASEVAVASAASAAFRRLELSLAKRLDPDEASRRARRLTAGTNALDGASTPDPDSSRAVFAGPTWTEGRGAEPRPPGPPDAPGPPDSTDSTDSTGPPEAARAQESDAWIDLLTTLRSSPNWNLTRAVTGQVVDVRILVLRRLVEDATELLAAREHAKRALLRLGGEVRRVHLELGRRLADAGRLEQPEDVDFLSERELIGADRVPSRLELSRRRRWLDGTAHDRLPNRFTGAPARQPRAPLTGDVLRGWSASGGRRRGRAVVLDAPDEPGLERGDILVTRATDASWAPSFMRAGAIVVEEGGPLSHAAIVARELGLPAVVNLPGVVDRLRRPHPIVVTVDGDEGTVSIEQEDPV